MKKILVIDGNSIINRAFYGIRPLTTKTGKHTNAIYGMVSMISKQLDAIKPDYAAVAFDLKHPTFRHEMYEGYKAGRHPTPEELLSQFDDAKEVLRLMGFTVLELPGWEADDIQGTIASMAHKSKDELRSYVLSGDRDLLQLIDDKITVLLATNKDTVTMKEEQFREKYGISPSEFVDMKALMGDSSDNIPGVKGIGEKTAATLISKFSTLEQIYESIDSSDISKGVREKLLANKDNAFLSRKLAKIDVNAPVGIELCDIEYNGFNKSGLYKKFCELELNSFITKFNLTGLESDEGDESVSDIQISSVEYTEVSADELCHLDAKVFALEIKDDGVYVGIEDKYYVYRGDISELKGFAEGKEIICYDGKSLFHTFEKHGINADSVRYLDLMLFEYVLSPGGGNAGVIMLSSCFIGKGAPANVSCVHLMNDLYKKFAELIAQNGQERIIYDLELPLINLLARIESTGFKVNKKGIEEFGEALKALAEDLKTRIYMQAGEVFNLNSPKQLGTVLYENLGLGAKVKKNKTGYSTDAQTLEELRHEAAIIDDILEYRQVTKLISTYTSVLSEVADENSRIHTEFKQALTATGRLSSAEPNLQNIPIKTKMGRELRRFFIAEEGYTLVDADYSQIELRLLAHIADDYNMQEAFIEGVDIHRKTASAVFGVPEELVNDEMRKKAKAVNFGIVYGIGGYSLAKDIGTSVAEATRYIKSYLLNYPFVDKYLEDVVAEATEKGYTTTPMGRRRYIPELKNSKMQLKAFGKRVAMNAPIQGAAADIMKLAMLRVDEAIKNENLDARIVMQVHDELIIEVRDDQAKRCMEICKEQMEKVADLKVPLIAEAGCGKNWLEAK